MAFGSLHKHKTHRNTRWGAGGKSLAVVLAEDKVDFFFNILRGFDGTFSVRSVGPAEFTEDREIGS